MDHHQPSSRRLRGHGDRRRQDFEGWGKRGWRDAAHLTDRPCGRRGEYRPVSAAFSQLPTQGLSALSPTLSGYLFDEISLAAPFMVAGALQLINALLFQRFFGAMDSAAMDSGRAADLAQQHAAVAAAPQQSY